ncbi:LysR family transcriptional regulator [Legionella quinlivanii]|uniref:LysR family transcriptional regulator n=1 Tax=Legionella quinlivanii TaxID=45073 RepID=A0A364LJI5_9GAMM|nr:LysR family transcriptional regulator [Legionella quinlivanii]RAP36649.1 LysR family transcriptional regulator [Legionella quinlivanii]
MLKGQDIAILIKLLLKLKAKEKIEFKSIAYELYISQSEVTKSIKRLEMAKLLMRYSDDRIELHKHEFMEFLVHSVKYHFPAEINIATRGMPAAYSSPHIKKLILSEELYVWPYINGKAKGLALTPLYKTLPHALDRSPDDNFYNLISALDLIRLGGKRENIIAKELLESYVWNQ